MISYKIDKQANTNVNSQLRDMSPVLEEIPATLQVLLEALSQHEASIGTPSINSFRYDIQKATQDAIASTQLIADQVKKLSAISEQAGKHLLAVEEHFGAALRDQRQSLNSAIANDRRGAPVA